jgi:hypothetical protein
MMPTGLTLSTISALFGLTHKIISHGMGGARLSRLRSFLVW